MKILIVDDSRAMRRIVQRAIRKAGFKGNVIIEAETGAEALETIQRDKPDLILSDWHMPEMSGLALKEALNAREIDIPFGFITSESSDEMRRTAAAAGANFLLAKPFTPDDMASVLEAIVK